jgi:hypothetical protein
MINLPEDIKIKSIALVKLGYMLHLYQLPEYLQVAAVLDRLYKNELYVYDLTDLNMLGEVIVGNDNITDELKTDIKNTLHVLSLFIECSSKVKRPCGFIQNCII